MIQSANFAWQVGKSRGALSGLTFFQFEATYRMVLRTMNPIEKLNKEFKRRTRAMEVTGGELSTYRSLAYVAPTMEYRWGFHPLSQWASIYTQNAALPQQPFSALTTNREARPMGYGVRPSPGS